MQAKKKKNEFAYLAVVVSVFFLPQHKTKYIFVFIRDTLIFGVAFAFAAISHFEYIA